MWSWSLANNVMRHDVKLHIIEIHLAGKILNWVGGWLDGWLVGESGNKANSAQFSWSLAIVVMNYLGKESIFGPIRDLINYLGLKPKFTISYIKKNT